MPQIKKLAFAPLFLLSFAFLCYQINPFLASTDFFSLSLESLIQPLILSVVVLITSFFFVLFATLAQDWKLVGVTALMAAILPVAFLPSPLGFYMAFGSTVSLALIFAILLNKLKNYLNFQPSILLYSPIKNLSTLLVLIIAFLYFQSLSAVISQKGFEIPDTLIDSVTRIAPVETDVLLPPPGYRLENTQTSETGSPGQSLIKDVVKSQVQGMIKPYEPFIAPVMAVLIFFTLISFVSLISLITPVLLWLTFYLLKSFGFVKFVTEMREVKKLVV